tara:strand:- start:118 stop:819 length:702 start_codon:yes stop_codon:yes gene_type:complete
MTSSNNRLEKLLIEGGGFPAFWYSFGYGKQMMRQITPTFIAGYSAGSLVAVLLLLPDCNTHQIMELFYNTAGCCNICALEPLIRSTMSTSLPNNIHEIANGKLGIILCETNNNRKCKMVIHWESKEEVIDCLVASCYIPLLMNGCNTSDERYKCRDAIFSRDLRDFTKEFDFIIRKGRPNNGVLHFIENIISIPPGEAIDLVYHGELACAYDVNIVKETTNKYPHITENQLFI